MGEDASLDDFLGGDAERSDEGARAKTDDEPADAGSDSPPASESAEAPRANADAEDSADADGPVGVEPAATTYAWDPGGAPCEACGEVVERRWRQDGAIVCVECKTWRR